MDQAAVASVTAISGSVAVCGGARCTSARCQRVLRAFEVELTRRALGRNVRLSPSPCRGFCTAGPIAVLQPLGVLYAHVQPEDVPEIVEETLIHGRIVTRLEYQEPEAQRTITSCEDMPLFSKQVRIALRNCGRIDPEQIDEYIARDGYAALGKVLGEMSPEGVIQELKESGLRGRGGAGFSTGMKWELCRRSPGTIKYVVCNADEGDPGAFMDRSILESDPHSLLEGMAIAAYAIGAGQGFVYCREEYPLAIDRLQLAIEQAREYGLLGDNILGTGFAFNIEVKQGAGAFVCGEETALISSIEGRRGEPRPRPPYPVVAGLWGHPTNINNVKSYAMTPQIILRGAAWFTGIGTPKAPGTAVFALTGKVNNTGLIEVPMGIPLGDIIFDVGGGILHGKKFKAVQTGGPLGGCLPARALNTPVDFDSLAEAGAVMGSGGMIVLDDDTCMVEFAKYFLTFAAAESCGKCVPCRIGGQRLLEALTRISEGRGRRQDLDTIKEVSTHMMGSSLCGLGQRTPGPVLATLRFFEDEFRTHIDDQLCRAGQCRALVRARCINTCPAGVDTPAYLALVAQGRYAEGLAVHRRRNPFALVCGRACPAFCESKCRRGELDEPIAIRLVKRFMADHEFAKPWTPEPVVGKAERAAAALRPVAVVGAGPAGLTAALRLAQRGYPVTVFERYPVAGGMMTWAIPEYRLPREPLLAEIENIRRAGVDIRCDAALGRDFTLDELLGARGYQAVILALGAHRSRRLGIAGEDLPGVVDGIDFLRRVAGEATLRVAGLPSGDSLPDVHGKRVAVVGGGDVAIDVARSALRLGAREVHVIYRRAGDDMPAAHLPEEIAAARQEGIRFHTLVNPVAVLGNGAVAGVRLQQQRLADFDDSARRRPVPLGADSYVLDVDVLIPAIGQVPDLAWLHSADIGRARGDTLQVDEAFSTTRRGVFAAGDAVSGPATIVEAVAQGNLVAVAVDQWLRTGSLAKPRFETAREDVAQGYDPAAYASAHRPETPRRPVAQREHNFQEVELGFDESGAQEEAKRCLRCDLEWLDAMHPPRPQGSEAAVGGCRALAEE
jgi:NADH-quinone oxidoreductase subunit F